MARHRLDKTDRDYSARKRLLRAKIGDMLLSTFTLFDDLPGFLNATKTRSGKRIVQILEQMLQLEVMTAPITGVVWALASLKRTDPDKFKLRWEIVKKTALLERELARYRFIPRAEVIVGGGGSGPSEWNALWRWSNSTYEKHLRMSPGEALQMILKLTQIGYLTRVRRCARCQKWLYARFRHQIFCSVTCQQKNYTQTERFRDHRRRYMRKRYQEHFRNLLPEKKLR
jgi:hypothetical protein